MRCLHSYLHQRVDFVHVDRGGIRPRTAVLLSGCCTAVFVTKAAAVHGLISESANSPKHTCFISQEVAEKEA